MAAHAARGVREGFAAVSHGVRAAAARTIVEAAFRHG